MSDRQKGEMGIWMTSALVVGTIIGSGIFMLPVSLAALGRNAFIGWIISGVGVLCIAYALGQLSKFGGDGIQANIEREFGPTAAFLAAWSFWVSNWTAQASVAVGAVSALSFIGPAFGNQATIVPLAIGSVIVITFINAMGVRASGRFSIVTVAIKVLPLLAVVWLFALRKASGGATAAAPPTPINFANVAAATALTFFAFTGFESATAPVGKVRNASRTIPRALLGGTGLRRPALPCRRDRHSVVAAGQRRRDSPAPFADVLVAHWGHGAASLAAFGIAVAAIGCLNGLVLATGELGYSMALRGDLPAIMTKTRGINTPVVAQVVGSGPDDPASPREQQPRHRQSVHLHHPAVDGSDRGRLLDRRAGRLETEAAPRSAASSSASGILFIVFANVSDRVGSRRLGPCSAGDRLWAAFDHAPHQFERFDHPADGGDSSRASGISRRSFAREAPQTHFARSQRPGL